MTIESRRLLFLLLTTIILQACVLEERYVINKDMSGTYEMTLNFAALLEGNPESDRKLYESMESAMDSISMGYDTIPGVSNVVPQLTDSTMGVSFAFEDLFEVDKLVEDDKREKNSKIFQRKGKLFVYTPDVDNIVDDLSQGEDVDTEPSSDDGAGKEDDFFTIRSIIVFDGNVKTKKMEHFRREGKNTFIYDSSEQGLDAVPVLEVKY